MKSDSLEEGRLTTTEARGRLSANLVQIERLIIDPHLVGNFLHHWMSLEGSASSPHKKSAHSVPPCGRFAPSFNFAILIELSIEQTCVMFRIFWSAS